MGQRQERAAKGVHRRALHAPKPVFLLKNPVLIANMARATIADISSAAALGYPSAPQTRTRKRDIDLALGKRACHILVQTPPNCPIDI